MKVVATAVYDRRARRLLSAVERATAELQIAMTLDAWPVVPGTGGARLRPGLPAAARVNAAAPA